MMMQLTLHPVWDKPLQRTEPTGKAWIFNNYIREGHGGVVTGSHTGGWIQDLLVEDNIMYKTDVGLRSKTNTPMGGGAKNILFKDNALEEIDGDGPFVFTSSYKIQMQLYSMSLHRNYFPI